MLCFTGFLLGCPVVGVYSCPPLVVVINEGLGLFLCHLVPSGYSLGPTEESPPEVHILNLFAGLVELFLRPTLYLIAPKLVDHLRVEVSIRVLKGFVHLSIPSHDGEDYKLDLLVVRYEQAATLWDFQGRPMIALTSAGKVLQVGGARPVSAGPHCP